MKNFCCYTELVEYEFENNKIRLITGPNGVGKTTLFSALQFTLYGNTASGARSDDVVNNVIGKNCHTYVEFIIQNDDIINHYRVDRYVKDSKLGDTVLLFRNGEKKPYKKGQKEVLPEIERLLVPQKLFSNTLLFGQKVKDFFTDLTDSDQKAIFRKVLLLDNYVLYYDEANKRINLKYVDLEDVNKRMSLIQSLIVNNKERIRISEEDKNLFEERKNREIDRLSNELESLFVKLIELKGKRKKYEHINDLALSTVNSKISHVQNLINNLHTERDYEVQQLIDLRNSKEAEFNSKSKELISQEELNYSKKLSEIDKYFNDTKFSYQENLNLLHRTKTEAKSKIDNNELQMTRNGGRISELQVAVNTKEAVCPTCKKPLTDKKVKDYLLSELKNLISDNEKMASENISSNILYDQAIQNENEINYSLTNTSDQVSAKIAEIKNEKGLKIYEINQRVSEAKEKLSEMYKERSQHISDKYLSKDTELDMELDSLIAEKHNLTVDLDEKSKIEKEISSQESEIKTSKAIIEEKEKETFNDNILKSCLIERDKLKMEKDALDVKTLDLLNSIQILEFWKEGFSSTGIPSLLIDEAIPFLNKAVSGYLEKVGGRYVASFDTLSTTKSGEYRDKINVNVLDTQTKANNRKQLSGGQTRVIDIAILLSLCDLQNDVQEMKTNILLLDEIFDSLDDSNIGYISSLLRTLVKGKAINLISHRHIDSIEADEVIRLF